MATAAFWILFLLGTATMIGGYLKYPPLTRWEEAIKNHDRPDEKAAIASQTCTRQWIMTGGLVLVLIAFAIAFQYS